MINSKNGRDKSIIHRSHNTQFITGMRLAYLTPPKSLGNGILHSQLKLTSLSIVEAGTTPSPSSLRTTLTPSFSRWGLGQVDGWFGKWYQARGADRPDGNATLVGEWRKFPGITKHLKCIGTRRSTWVRQFKQSRSDLCRVTDKGRPVLLGNMTFTWKAPTIDFGPIRQPLLKSSAVNRWWFNVVSECKVEGGQVVANNSPFDVTSENF